MMGGEEGRRAVCRGRSDGEAVGVRVWDGAGEDSCQGGSRHGDVSLDPLQEGLVTQLLQSCRTQGHALPGAAHSL